MAAEVLNFPANRNYSAVDWRPPNDNERVICIGRTGSGKSQMLAWLMSQSSFDRRPWIVIDYKGELFFHEMRKHKLFRGILKPGSGLPKQPGFYYMRPREGRDDDELDEFLWRVKNRGRTGLVFDECAWLPAGPGSAVRSILQQGRALRIPVLAGNQRPVNLGDRNFIEQADYICSFNLTGDDDRKTIKNYIPVDPERLRHLPEFCSIWYDVKRDRVYELTPVPEKRYILSDIAARTPRRLFDW